MTETRKVEDKFQKVYVLVALLPTSPGWTDQPWTGIAGIFNDFREASEAAENSAYETWIAQFPVGVPLRDFVVYLQGTHSQGLRDSEEQFPDCLVVGPDLWEEHFG